ncbi:DUF4064 domain-containing protein [Vagococcus fluvialis]|uniref:DUF4064 domain-containing protein n=1 Tax=Vagococcus fluvialis TaxID=2738 RepID=UPI001A8DC131|nr:DUF4064 domain-containing protein [Vagococcus fluvialis]MBO0488168.1 DUF4064 domain-containing protein [Vagococcus fluvialis]
MIERTTEKRLLIAVGVWNIITSVLTIFGYSSWFKNEGVKIFEANNQLTYLNTSMLDSLVSIILVFGLLIFLIGVINIYMSKKVSGIKNYWKMNVWLIICLIIHFVSFDIVGILLYLVTFVIYIARTKAFKVKRLHFREEF